MDADFCCKFRLYLFEPFGYNCLETERDLIKQVINIRHRQFATGLFWQPLGVGNTAQNYAKHLAKSNGQKYTLYIGYKSMVGLTNGRDGAHAGMPSAAVEVLNALSEFVSFLGVFQVGNRFYLVAVRNGVIIRDILYDNADLARRAYTQLAELPDWGALFAPSLWGMPKSQEKNLSDLIGRRVTAKLRQIGAFGSIVSTLFFVILFICFGFYWLSDKNLDINRKIPNLNTKAAQEYRRLVELKQQQQNILKQEPGVVEKVQVAFEYPYDRLPNVEDRANLCYKAIAFVMQPLPGWNQVYAKCDEEFVSATFARDFGTLNDFYEIGAELMPGAIVQQISEDEIIVRVRLPQLDTYSSLDERDQSTLVRDVTTLFQRSNIRASIQGVTDTILNGNKTEKLYITEISAESKLIPAEFMQAFSDFGGVYMVSVAWRANTKMWSYEVIIYSK